MANLGKGWFVPSCFELFNCLDVKEVHEFSCSEKSPVGRRPLFFCVVAVLIRWNRLLNSLVIVAERLTGRNCLKRKYLKILITGLFTGKASLALAVRHGQ